VSSLKGDRAAQRKRRAKFSREDLKAAQERKAHAKPKMDPNIRVKKINLDKLEEDLD
jgi:hypothetical protein